MPATVQTLGIALLATSWRAPRSGPSRSGRWTRAGALVREQPRSLDGYECLLTHPFAHGAKVLASSRRSRGERPSGRCGRSGRQSVPELLRGPGPT